MALRRMFPTSLTVCILALETLVLAILALYPSVQDPGLSNLNAAVYELLAPVSVVFLLGLLCAWLLRLVIAETSRRIPRFPSFVRFLSEPFVSLFRSVRTVSLSESSLGFRTLSCPRFLLLISMVLSTLLAYVPYRPDLNPGGSLVGIDSPLYVTWVSQMLQRPPAQAIQYSFVQGLDGSRPLVLIILYLVASIGLSPSQVVEFAPLVLAPLLSLSCFVFVRFGQGSRGLAGLTALFSPSSFYVTVGLYGGYYANWLAMIEVFLFLTSLLLFSRSLSLRNFATMFALSVALFFTHPWTWAFAAAVGLVFTIAIWRETGRFLHVRSMVGIVTTGIVLDLLKSWMFATRTVAADLVTKVPLSVGQVVGLWSNLVDALLFTHGGLLGNWLLLGLGFLSVLALRFRDLFERLLIIWIGVASVPFLLLDGYHQARIIYDLPIPVLASTGLLFFLSQVGSRNIRWRGLLIALVLVANTTYALQGLLLL